jgi:Rad3-related DNA helicase
VLCPYSYVIDRYIRKSTSIDIQGSILVFDESHNIASVARDAASGTFSVDFSLSLVLPLTYILDLQRQQLLSTKEVFLLYDKRCSTAISCLRGLVNLLEVTEAFPFFKCLVRKVFFLMLC